LAKINLKFILVLVYLAQYRLDICYIVSKINFILNAFFRLLYINNDISKTDKYFSKFNNIWVNILTKACVEIELKFKYRILPAIKRIINIKIFLNLSSCRKKRSKKLIKNAKPIQPLKQFYKYRNLYYSKNKTGC